MEKKLKGKTALVTGASRGIGRVVALALAREGADVVITSRDHGKLLELEAELKKTGSRVLSVAGDACMENDVAAVRNKTMDFGAVDILINNVGIAKYAAFNEISLEDFDWMMNTNMRSSYLFTKAFLPVMLERKTGYVIFIASVSGLYGFPGETAYCASKHAQVGFAKALEREVFDKGIKVSVIAPGGVNTEHAFGTGRTAGDANLKSYIEPQAIADAVIFCLTQPANTRTFLLGMRPVNEGLYD